MFLYYVKLLHCTPALIPGPSSFLGAFPPHCLLPHLCPITPLPLTSSLPSPNIHRPVNTTAGTPSPLASKLTAHRGPELVASQYTAQPCSTSSWGMSRSPWSLIPSLIPLTIGITNSHPPVYLDASKWSFMLPCVGNYSGPAPSLG